jgi:CRP/FNR family transcriptional regulator, cyclic AMP receptor protein
MAAWAAENPSSSGDFLTFREGVKMIISETELFRGINYKEMEVIATICCEEGYIEGTVLFQQDEDASCLYILEEGTVNLIIQNGAILVYKLEEPGEVFGWSSMVENGKYTASGICFTDVKAIKIEKDRLDKVFNNHPDVGLKVLRRLGGVFSKRVSTAYKHLLMTQKSYSIAS